MPVWMNLITNIIIPVIVLIIMLRNKKKGRRSYDISIVVVGLFFGDIIYRIGQGLYSDMELIILTIGNLFIYSTYWWISKAIIQTNKANNYN